MRVTSQYCTLSTIYTPHLHTQQSTLYIPHFTIYSTQYIPHPTVNTQFYTPHAPSHSVLHASHFTVCNLQCTFPSPFPHFTFQLHIVHCTLDSTLSTPHFTSYTPRFTLHTPHTLHSTLCTHSTLHMFHSSHSTLNSLQLHVDSGNQWENTQYCVSILTWYYVNVVGNTATGPSGPSLRAENGFGLWLFDVHARKSTNLFNTQAIELISVYGWFFCI